MSSNNEDPPDGDDLPAAAEPRRFHREHRPGDAQHFFTLAPVLAVHQGPWTYYRRPRLGAALKIAALVAGAVAAVALIVDQRRADTLLEGDLVVAGIAFGFLLMVLIGSPGIAVSRGKIRYSPSGRKLAMNDEEYRGDAAATASIHAGLSAANLTHHTIHSITRGAPSKGKIVVSAYWSGRDDYAVATVHLDEGDGGLLIWPPAPIPQDLVGGLIRSESSTFDVSAATQ